MTLLPEYKRRRRIDLARAWRGEAQDCAADAESAFGFIRVMNEPGWLSYVVMAQRAAARAAYSARRAVEAAGDGPFRARLHARQAQEAAALASRYAREAHEISSSW